MKIKIIKCENINCWYYEKVGEEFIVIKESDFMGYMVKKHTGVNFYVEREDCEIIEESETEN